MNLERRDFIKYMAIGLGAGAITAFTRRGHSGFPDAPPSTPTPTPKPERETFPDTIMTRMVMPWYKDAEKRREVKMVPGSEAEIRINKELNKGRVNFYVQFNMEYLERPTNDKPGVFFGPGFIISLDLQKQRADLIRFSHDLFSPNVSFLLKKHWIMEPRTRIDQGYAVGGLGLMGDDMERATGLSMDFRAVLDEADLATYIDKIGGIDVAMPLEFNLDNYFWKGVMREKKVFRQGKTYHMNGEEAVGFVKAVSNPAIGPYEQSNRANLLVLPIIQKILDPRSFQILESVSYWGGLLDGRTGAADFRTGDIMKPQVTDLLAQPGYSGYRYFYFAEPQSSDTGGLMRPPGRMDMYVPTGAKLGTDNALVDYWGSSRQKTWEFLTAP